MQKQEHFLELVTLVAAFYTLFVFLKTALRAFRSLVQDVKN